MRPVLPDSVLQILPRRRRTTRMGAALRGLAWAALTLFGILALVGRFL